MMYPPLKPEIMHDLQCWPENEVKLTRTPMKNLPEPSINSLKDGESSTKISTGVRARYSPAEEKESFNLRYKGTQKQVDTNIRKQKQQGVRKTSVSEKKLKTLKYFTKKKIIVGRILRQTPHTAWVQTKGIQPRLLRNSGFVFVSNLKLYGLCRASQLGDNVAYKSVWRTGLSLSFLDIEQPNAPQQEVFQED